jgi:predicted transcriptional regulator
MAFSLNPLKSPVAGSRRGSAYRLEKKQALRCVKRISKANIVEAVISRDEAHMTLVGELLDLFGGRPKPVMARLVESGRLTLGDIKEAEVALKTLLKKGGSR